jgi:transcriptional regulator with XRE-family HTH domain
MDLKPILIWQRLNDTAAKTEKPLNQAAEKTGVSSGTISDWKNSYPRVDKLAVVTDFYGVSLDYVVFGNRKADELSPEESLLVNAFRQLDSRDQNDILGNVKLKLENAKKDTASSSLGNV